GGGTSDRWQRCAWRHYGKVAGTLRCERRSRTRNSPQRSRQSCRQREYSVQQGLRWLGAGLSWPQLPALSCEEYRWPFRDHRWTRQVQRGSRRSPHWCVREALSRDVLGFAWLAIVYSSLCWPSENLRFRLICDPGCREGPATLGHDHDGAGPFER